MSGDPPFAFSHVKTASGAITGPVAYRGKVGCDWPLCTRRSDTPDACFGWHCSVCDGPCSMQGHLVNGCPERAS